MTSPDNHLLRIGAWRVDPALDEISRDGTSVKLEPRTMRLLVCLAGRAGQVVSVEQLLDEVWKDVVVTPNSVYHAVAELRRSLGDDPKEPTYIANVLRRGYRLLAPVAPWVDAPAELAAHPPATTSTATTAPAAGAATPSPLRRFGVAASVALVAMFVLGYFMTDKLWLSKATRAVEYAGTPAGIVVSDKSIAVLPFVDMSEKKDQEYFADGMAEEIIDRLSKVPELYVPARTSSFFFRGKATKIPDIARELNVAHVLEGSLRKSGNHLRITAQLVRADNGYHVWSETFDRQLDDIFKVQDEIAGAVVKALRVSLLKGDVPMATPTSSTEAYTLYLQARSIAAGRAADTDYVAAIKYLQQAVTLDPRFASAWAALANIFVDEYSWRRSRPYGEAQSEAHKAAEQALGLDPKLSDGHLALAKILFAFDFNWNASENEYDRALEINPRNADALRWKSYLALRLNRSDQALELAQRAVSYDPLNSWNFFAIAAALSAKSSFTESEAAYRKGLELNPTGVGLHALLGEVLVVKGDPRAGLAEMNREYDDRWRQMSVPFALDALGRKSEANVEVATLEEKYAAYVPAAIAYLYSCRKDTDRAILWLDRAFR
jgi:TolB-like protein/DNA-binding winged helix-turn-helix (wHTH) protein/Flp pilus assembly protein TadD